MPPRKSPRKKPQAKKSPSKKPRSRKPPPDEVVDRGEEKRSRRRLARAAAAVVGLGIAVKRVLRKR
jgi:hypothetical protein